jgi:hypothetical protein
MSGTTRADGFGSFGRDSYLRAFYLTTLSSSAPSLPRITRKRRLVGRSDPIRSMGLEEDHRLGIAGPLRTKPLVDGIHEAPGGADSGGGPTIGGPALARCEVGRNPRSTDCLSL